MALINKLFIYVKTRAVFDEKLAAGDFSNTSIIFIEDTSEIWTHGKFYASLGDISSDISALESDIKSILRGEKISGSNAIVVTPTVESEGVIPVPSISLKIDTADKVLTQGEEGLLANVTLEKADAPAAGLASQYKLVGKDGTQLGATIDIAKDQFLKSAAFIPAATEEDHTADETVVVGDPYLKFVFQTTEEDTTSYVAVKSLVDVYTAGNGIDVTGNVVSIKVKDGEAYLEATADGVATKGIAELDARVGTARVEGETPADPTGIFKIIEDNEKVTAEALNDLNVRVGNPATEDLSATGVYEYVDNLLTWEELG